MLRKHKRHKTHPAESYQKNLRRNGYTKTNENEQFSEIQTAAYKKTNTRFKLSTFGRSKRNTGHLLIIQKTTLYAKTHNIQRKIPWTKDARKTKWFGNTKKYLETKNDNRSSQKIFGSYKQRVVESALD